MAASFTHIYASLHFRRGQAWVYSKDSNTIDYYYIWPIVGPVRDRPSSTRAID